MYTRIFIVTVVLLLVASVIAASLGFVAGTHRVKQVSIRLEKVIEQLDTLERALTQTQSNFALTLDEERTARVALSETYQANREAQSTLTEQLSELSASVEDQASQLAASDSASLAAQWSQYVYKVTCRVVLPDGDERVSRGSATLENKDGVTQFITSKHVIEEEGKIAQACSLSVPGEPGEIDIAGENLSYDAEKDLAYGIVSDAVAAVPQNRRCTTKPDIGDKVLVLGYPGIGAKESITVTEGIISGFDEDFYTTSAKIEKGNSGGAAIHMKNNCFLGLPTLVVSGRVESLARILPLL